MFLHDFYSYYNYWNIAKVKSKIQYKTNEILFIAMLTLCLFINTNQNNQQYETYEKIDDLYESEAVKTKTTNCIKK